MDEAEQAPRVERESDAADRRAQERARLVRELPDMAAQQLSGIAVQAQGYRGSDDPEELRIVLREIGRAASSALTALRMLVRVLHRSAADGASTDGVAEATELTRPAPPDEAAAQTAARLVALGFDVEVGVPDMVDRLDLTVRRTISRIVEVVADEAERCELGGERCVLGVRATGHDVRVEIRLEQVHGRLDDLGEGLAGLRERVQLVGGRLDIELTEDWLVLARLPHEV